MAYREKIISFGQWAPDQYAPNTDTMATVTNAYPVPGGYRGMDQFVVITSNTGGANGGFESFYAGVYTVFTGGATQLFSMAAGATAFTDRSGGAYTIGSWWDFAQFGNKVIACPGGAVGLSPPQSLTLPVAGNFAALGGSPPNASYVAVVRDFVVLGYTYDAVDGSQPTRVRWSGITDETSWPTTPAGKAAVMSDWQDLRQEGGSIQRIVGGAYGIILQERMITRMTMSGPPKFFDFDTINFDLGCAAPMSVVKADTDIYFLSNQGFVKLAPSGEITRIGFGRVDTYADTLIYSGGTPQNSVVGAYCQDTASVWWILDAGNNAGIQKILVYSVPLDRWTQHDMSGYSAVVPLFMLSARRALAKNRPSLMGNDSKFYNAIPGNADATMLLETSEWLLTPNRHSLVQLVRPLQTGPFTSPTITPVTRATQEDTPTVQTAFTQNATTKYFQGRQDALLHAFRFGGANAPQITTVPAKVSGLVVSYTSGGPV